ncbi:CPBP family intramembrane metalloprotease [Rhodobacterales bacterium HKCCE3408]|nr:CPBP family intramembrane metalloprotease [Rhodobacterales bacterium HKCCE3408]
MQYAAHEAFIAPARHRPQIWRLILGIVLAAIVYVAVMVAIIAGAIWIANGPALMTEMSDWLVSDRLAQAPLEREITDVVTARTPTDMLIVLSTFAGMALGAMAAARVMHGRGLATLTGPFAPMLRHMGLAIVIAAPILAVTAILPPVLSTVENLDLPLWASFAPLALLMILIQTGAEELFFRGYLQQQLAARFRSPIVWMVLPSLLFGLGHLNPDQYGPQAWLIVGVTALVGLLAADLTARTGTLGAAWGLHFANNVAAILFVSMDGPMSGLALRVVPAANLPPDLLTTLLIRDTIVLVAIWAAIRFALRPRPQPT